MFSTAMTDSPLPTDLGSTAVTNFFGQSVSLSLASLPSASNVSGGQFRFYFDGAPNSYETGLLGDVVVNATIGSVPEPGSYALMLGGVMALAFFGLRRRMTI